MNNSVTKKRLMSYDLMRIIAMFAVIIIHVSAENWYVTNIDKNFLTNNFINGLVHPWAVPIFIAISGALLLKKDIDYKTIFKKYIPKFLICLVVWHFIYYFYTSPTFSVNSFIRCTLELIKGNSYSHLWYVYFMLGLYVALPFISRLVKSLDKKYLLILILISIIVGIVIPNIQAFTTRDLYSYTKHYMLFKFDKFFAYLLIGYYLSIYKIKNNKVIIGTSIVGVILLVLNALLGNSASLALNAPKTYADTYSIVALPVVISIISIIYKLTDNKESKFINTLGELTFGTYLVHFLVIKILTSNGIHGNIINPVFGVILVSLLVFICSYIISYIISKIPVVKKIIGI